MEKDTCYRFSMWRIKSELEDAGAPYDRRAAVYDRLVRSRTYNRLAWSTTPYEYAQFAAEAIASADGPLLEAAAGSAAATAELHARSPRPTVLVDLSQAMLERAAHRIAAARDDGELEFPRTSASCRPTCSRCRFQRTGSAPSSGWDSPTCSRTYPRS